MYIRTLLILLVLGALTLFTMVNWSAFTTPTTLSVVFATVEAPLGLVLLGVAITLAVLFLIYVAYLQSSVLLETRRHQREMVAQRELAENAEMSRLGALQTALEDQLKALAQQNEATKSALGARLERLDSEVRQSIAECQNSLAASLAEVEDRLERDANDGQSRKPGRLTA